MKSSTMVDLVWEHDLVLSGTSGAAKLTLDSAGQAGPSPMQALGFAVAACMAMDIVHVLRKGRHDLRGLKAALVAQRATEEPRRFTSVTIHFTITGQVPPAPIQRAIDLSRDKYCSVWNSLRQDVPLETTFTVVESAG
jgi:putative redox protein